MPKSLQKHGKRLRNIILLIVSVFGVVAIFAMLIAGGEMAVLNPAGVIASKEKNLIIMTTLLGLFVVIPVFVLLFTVAWRYREGNTKARYTPDADGNRWLEGLWWGIPAVIIVILGVITWQSTHELDPYKPIVSDTKQLNIQVVSLEWKWLFIYPELGVASVNYLPIPAKTPISFQITSDAPMNSFWIPNLGGQVYAMSGMSTKLHLEADEVGTYRGSSANISGEGFAGMTFDAQSMTKADFDAWVQRAVGSSNMLTYDSYGVLAKPSKNNPPATYMLMDNNLYNKIIMKYMTPTDNTEMKAM